MPLLLLLLLLPCGWLASERRLLLLISFGAGRVTRRAELATSGASSAELSSVAEVEGSRSLRLLLRLTPAVADIGATRCLGAASAPLEEPSPSCAEDQN